jgi:hypothetical protein
VRGSPAYAPAHHSRSGEQIGEASEPSIVLSKRALEGHLFEGGILRYVFHMFVLGVIFEVGIHLRS